MSVTDARSLEGAAPPCIRLCTLDDDDFCLGCHREIAEICAWASASDAERLSIIEAAEVRRLGRQSRD